MQGEERRKTLQNFGPNALKDAEKKGIKSFREYENDFRKRFGTCPGDMARARRSNASLGSTLRLGSRTPAARKTAAKSRIVQASKVAPKGAARKTVKSSKPQTTIGPWYSAAVKAWGKPHADRARASGVNSAQGALEYAAKHNLSALPAKGKKQPTAKAVTAQARPSAVAALKSKGESAQLQAFSRRFGADFACRAFKAGCRTMEEADALYCKDNRAGLEAESPLGAADPIARAAFAIKQRRAAAADRKAASRRPGPTAAERQRREIALLKKGVRPSVARAAAAMRI